MYPATNNLSIPLQTQEVSLSADIVSLWGTPNGTNSTGSTFQIPEFINESAGVYIFYTYNWDNVQIAIQIHIISSPRIEGILTHIEMKLCLISMHSPSINSSVPQLWLTYISSEAFLFTDSASYIPFIVG